MTSIPHDEVRDLMPDGQPRPNLPLLRKVLDHIDAHPEEWVQDEWATPTDCGTAYCIAGHALHMNGVKVFADAGEEVADAARDLLGLTKQESGNGWEIAGGIFASNNTRADVQMYAEAIAARAGERL